MRAISQEQLEIMEAKHKLWLYGVGGEQADFSDCCLEGLILSHKMFDKAIFRNSDLSVCSMNDGWFMYADFAGARMNAVNAVNSAFIEAKFIGTEAIESDFQDCYFVGADFENAVFDVSDFSKSKMKNCNILNTSFKSADLSDTVLKYQVKESIFKMTLKAKERTVKFTLPTTETVLKSVLRKLDLNNFSECEVINSESNIPYIADIEFGNEIKKLNELCHEIDKLKKQNVQIINLCEAVKEKHLNKVTDILEFVRKSYCVPLNYKPSYVNSDIDQSDKKCFFRLFIAPVSQGEQKITCRHGQWISLPCEREKLDEIARSFGENRIEDMGYYDFQSELIGIRDESFGDMYRINELNLLAEKLSELSDYEYIKLKAIMKSQDFREISDAVECINCLDRYGFDMNIRNEFEFGREYLSRNLSPNFDLSVFGQASLFDVGHKVLKCKGAVSTLYGVIYGKDQDLYSAITVEQEHELSEECEEEMTEDKLQDFNLETEMG